MNCLIRKRTEAEDQTDGQGGQDILAHCIPVRQLGLPRQKATAASPGQEASTGGGGVLRVSPPERELNFLMRNARGKIQGICDNLLFIFHGVLFRSS